MFLSPVVLLWWLKPLALPNGEKEKEETMSSGNLKVQILVLLVLSGNDECVQKKLQFWGR
jgi:hypothetical protein